MKLILALIGMIIDERRFYKEEIQELANTYI